MCRHAGGLMFDVTLTGAFLAGLISFLSPCVLPMVPFYLSYLAGVIVNTMAADSAVAASRSPSKSSAFPRLMSP